MIPQRRQEVRVNGRRKLTPYRQLNVDPLLVGSIFVEVSGSSAVVLAGLVFGDAGAAASGGGLTAGRGAEALGAAAVGVGEQAGDLGGDDLAAGVAGEPAAGQTGPAWRQSVTHWRVRC
jgi:hypothetical protein